MNQHFAATTHHCRNRQPCNDSFFIPSPAGKPTAQTLERRETFSLDLVDRLQRQCDRVVENLDADSTDLARYLSLIALSEQNEALFYYVVMSDPKRFFPFLHDPEMANKCLAGGHLYRRPRGLYITRKGTAFRMEHRVDQPLPRRREFTIRIE